MITDTGMGQRICIFFLWCQELYLINIFLDSFWPSVIFPHLWWSLNQIWMGSKEPGMLPHNSTTHKKNYLWLFCILQPSTEIQPFTKDLRKISSEVLQPVENPPSCNKHRLPIFTPFCIVCLKPGCRLCCAKCRLLLQILQWRSSFAYKMSSSTPPQNNDDVVFHKTSNIPTMTRLLLPHISLIIIIMKSF